MCTVSMIMDHYNDKWSPRIGQTQPFYPNPWPTNVFPKPISDEEIAEFRRLLERAREYDKRHNEPDCELTEKRETLKRIAKQLGVDIAFVDQPQSADAVGQATKNPI